jgi:hypothetical protein
MQSGVPTTPIRPVAADVGGDARGEGLARDESSIPPVFLRGRRALDFPLVYFDHPAPPVVMMPATRSVTVALAHHYVPSAGIIVIARRRAAVPLVNVNHGTRGLDDVDFPHGRRVYDVDLFDGLGMDDVDFARRMPFDDRHPRRRGPVFVNVGKRNLVARYRSQPKQARGRQPSDS